MVAFACVEGIFFSGSFCSIYWLKKRGMMPGLTFSNELISRDEGLHRDFACLLYTMLNNTPGEEKLRKIVTEAVEIEKEFVCDALPCALVGMNADMMEDYLKFIANRRLTQIGLKEAFAGAGNPFPWMSEIMDLKKEKNFFETRVVDYQVGGALNWD